MKDESFLTILVEEASNTYHAQSSQGKNAQVAAIQALNRHNVWNKPTRDLLLSKICSALGKNGGKTTATRRR